MRVIREIPVRHIIMDRWPHGRRTLELMRHLEAGGTVPPIHVEETGDGRYRILDGRHRVLAYKMLEYQYIVARFWAKRG